MAILFDQFDRPIEAGAAKRPDSREISIASVRDRWSTYPSNGLTPQRLASILRAADNGDVSRQAELFEEMEEKDAHLASQFQVRKLAVQGLEWEVLPRGGDSASRRVSDFCREALRSLPDFDEHVLDLLDAIPKGFSLMEILWEAGERECRIRELRWIHPKKLTFWDSMTPRLLTDEDPVRGVDLPPFKFVYHRCKARSGYDTRGGLMRVCAWMYLFKNYCIKDWVAFAEVYGMPLRVGKYDSGASKADKDALIQAVRALGSDAAGIISKSTEIEFIEAQKNSGGQNLYESLVRFCDAQMSKAILGQTLTSEAGGAKGQGSLALGRVHADVRHDLTEADAKALSKTISRQLLRPLVGFNFGWDVPVPAFKFMCEAPEDLKSVAETYKILADMGFDLSQEHVSERFKIPLPQKSETPLLARHSAGSAVLAKQGRAPGRDAADVIADQLFERARNEISAPVDAVRRLLDSSDSLDAFRDGLIDLYGTRDPTALGEMLQRALALADLAGRFDASGGGER